MKRSRAPTSTDEPAEKPTDGTTHLLAGHVTQQTLHGHAAVAQQHGDHARRHTSKERGVEEIRRPQRRRERCAPRSFSALQRRRRLLDSTRKMGRVEPLLRDLGRLSRGEGNIVEARIHGVGKAAIAAWNESVNRGIGGRSIEDGGHAAGSRGGEKGGQEVEEEVGGTVDKLPAHSLHHTDRLQDLCERPVAPLRRGRKRRTRRGAGCSDSPPQAQQTGPREAGGCTAPVYVRTKGKHNRRHRAREGESLDSFENA